MVKVTMQAELVEANPNMDGMPPGSTHWKVRLRCQGRSMTVYYSQGPAHCSEPKVDDVMECLVSDTLSVESANGFEDWASDLGWAPDSKAFQCWEVCQRQGKSLRRLLGAAFDAWVDKIQGGAS